MSPPLHLAIGRTQATEAVFTDSAGLTSLGLTLAELPNITRAFAPMVREGRYEVSEMAIATFLMAKAQGAPLVLLPAILSARHPEASLLSRRDGPIRAPADLHDKREDLRDKRVGLRDKREDLRAKRVGIRAYSQTTGLWLRGILAESHGLPAEALQWVTFEDAHVAGFQDPPWAERAAPGADMLAMLLAGELDAAIFGSEGAASDALAPVFADAAAAGQAFRATHGFMPVNLLLVARTDVAAARPEALAGLLARLRAGGIETPRRAALTPALATAARLCHAQGLTPRTLTLHEIWAGTPDRFR